MDANVKKMLLIGIAVLAGFIVVICIVSYFYYASSFKTYVNKKELFEIDYPAGWKIFEYPQPGAIVSFVAPKRTALEAFQRNIGISRTDLSRKPLTLEQYVSVTINQMTAVFKDVKVLESKSMQISGRPGHKFIFASSAPGGFTVVVYAFLFHNMAYNITYTGLADQYQTDKETIKLVINSLKLAF